jgi:hypothetical protein
MDSVRHTQEENFVEDTIRGVHLHLLDRRLQICPPINTLINQSKVVVELYVSSPLTRRYMTYDLMSCEKLWPGSILHKETLYRLHR